MPGSGGSFTRTPVLYCNVAVRQRVRARLRRACRGLAVWTQGNVAYSRTHTACADVELSCHGTADNDHDADYPEEGILFSCDGELMYKIAGHAKADVRVLGHDARLDAHA